MAINKDILLLSRGSNNEVVYEIKSEHRFQDALLNFHKARMEELKNLGWIS